MPVQPGGKCSIVSTLDAGVALGELSRDLAGAVGAAIVDDQDLEIRIGLPADRAEAVGQVELLRPWREGSPRPAAGQVARSGAS